MTKSLLAITLFCTTLFFIADPALARLNTLTGGISVNYDHDETTYDTEDISIDESTDTELAENIPEETSIDTRDNLLRKFSISPSFIFETKSSIDNITIRYNPSFGYDDEDSQSEVDHNFQFSAYRDFTSNLRFNFNNKFIYSDDPELLPENESSDYNEDRKRFWTNDLELHSSYDYANNSSIGGGYNFRVLRNDDTGLGGYEDYDKHTASLDLRHQFTHSWNIIFKTSYTKGLFDPPDQEVVDVVENTINDISPAVIEDINSDELSNDLSEYRTTSIVNWAFSPNKTFSIAHSYIGSNYDAILQNDSTLHNFTLGTKYQYNKRIDFELGGGPSYEKTDTFDANWDYNAHFDLAYQFAKKSNLSAGIEKNYDIQNFSYGNSGLYKEQGLTDYWKFEIKLSHTIMQNLNSSLWVNYRDEQQENLLYELVNSEDTGEDLEALDNETFREETLINRSIYEAGASLTYNFLQWYTTSVRYVYRQQDSDESNDSYDEHRVLVTLSVQKELFRW